MDAHRNGILKNASVMVPCPAIEEAARMFVGERGLCCGLHATVNAEWDSFRWGPVLAPERIPSLVDGEGHFFQTTRALHEHGAQVSEIMAELQAQLDRARELGFDVRYVDTHMGFAWVAEGLDGAIESWCQREGVRYSRHYAQRLPQVEVGGDPVERFIAQLDAAAHGQYLVVGHPAYDNDEMRALGHEGNPGHVLAPRRDWQRRIFTDSRVLRYCLENDVVPTRYDQAQRLR
jgi:predicted glycoside hydrolase/deacetylase ChbG (UPF0249 family)